MFVGPGLTDVHDFNLLRKVVQGCIFQRAAGLDVVCAAAAAYKKSHR